MSRAPHATPHAHTRAHTPSHARPFSPAASHARESQDGRREGPQGAPPSPTGAATRGGLRSQSRAVGGPVFRASDEWPVHTCPAVSRPSQPRWLGPSGGRWGQVGAAVALVRPVEIWEGCLSIWRVRVGLSTHVCRCAALGSWRSSSLGGEWVPVPVPTSCAELGRTCRCLGGWREGRGRERRQEQRGQSLEWPGGPGAVTGWWALGRRAMWTRPPPGLLSGGGTALVLHRGLEP